MCTQPSTSPCNSQPSAVPQSTIPLRLRSALIIFRRPISDAHLFKRRIAFNLTRTYAESITYKIFVLVIFTRTRKIVRSATTITPAKGTILARLGNGYLIFPLKPVSLEWERDDAMPRIHFHAVFPYANSTRGDIEDAYTSTVWLATIPRTPTAIRHPITRVHPKLVRFSQQVRYLLVLLVFPK